MVLSFITCVIQKFYILILIFTLSALLYYFIINSPHNKNINKKPPLKIYYPNILYVDQYGKIHKKIEI